MKLLVADDHALLREGLKQLLQVLSDDIVIYEAQDGKEVLKLLERIPQIDALLLDLFMPDMDGFVLLNRICNAYPDIPIVVLSVSTNPVHIRKVIDCGGSGFIPKSTRPEVIVSAIRLVLSGGVYIPPNSLNPVQTEQQQNRFADESEYSILPDLDLIEGLTDRQREVLVLLGQGKSNKAIAQQLRLSENTIKIHVTAILKTLGVRNRTQAVLAAQKYGVAV